ncbi:MAG: Bifunctional adenosylcobalamin biosynthesis protein CobP [Syntrophaceae bacterium PtaU1.Bin231]|nr:MAG: Bifunctional adenosylcobalamin biosynthesis protein CobP [Syntrophaceae bacterium PtaU1.Bin231]
MARVILVTGGCRSGKSAYAQQLAESLTGRRTYVATSPIIDAEMAARVKKHREARARSAWDTIEAPLDLAGAVGRGGGEDILLVDCLTLWVNNVLHEAQREGRKITEEQITVLCGDVLRTCRQRGGTVIFVTNEVGMGIVPDNPLARGFRDLAGRCNQTVAAKADEVWFVVSGIPVKIK